MNTQNRKTGRTSYSSLSKFLPVVLCVTGLLLVSCSGDNSTGTEPPEDPDPTVDRLVSFSEDINPVFGASCAISGCHDAGTQMSGVDLSSYNAALNSVGAQYGEEIINPNNPDASPLVDKIEADPDFGVRMPKDRNSLAQADIDSIRAWIEDGAPNN